MIQLRNTTSSIIRKEDREGTCFLGGRKKAENFTFTHERAQCGVKRGHEDNWVTFLRTKGLVNIQ
jgi:hypothetical protein